MLSNLTQAALFDWPFAALVAGAAGLLCLLLWPRKPEAPPRWRDPAWLVCWMLPLYMVHQFEEHGLNVLGQRYHFMAELCGALGYAQTVGCPATPSFIFAVNVGGVWMAGLLAIAYRHRNVLVGACALGIPLVNTLAHVGQAFVHGYNSGLLTAVVLFLPLCAWTLRQLWRAGILNLARTAAVVATGVALHAVLMGSLLTYGQGWLGEAPLLFINTLDGLLPWAVASLLLRWANERRATLVG